MEYLFLRRKKTSGTSVRQKALLYRAAGREWTARFSSLSDVRPADSLIYKGILYQLEIRRAVRCPAPGCSGCCGRWQARAPGSS